MNALTISVMNSDTRVKATVLQNHYVSIDDLHSFYEKEYESLVKFGVLFILPRELVEEIIQDIFLKLVVKVKANKRLGIENIEAYVKTAITLRAKDHHRRNFLRASKEAQLKSVDNLTPEKELTANQEKLLELVDKLPAAQKACIVYKCFEDRTIDEISKILGVSPGTVKSNLHKAMGNLKKVLGN